MQKLSLFLFAALTSLLSCKKDTEVIDPGYAYFPDATGQYVIYEGDSIQYNDDLESPHDTFRFMVKEVIESVFYDNEGRPTLRIERYYKMENDTIPYSAMQWKLSDVWSANRTATSAERVEEDQRYVKLIFPLAEGKKWNGNAYNTQGAWEYEYSSVHEGGTVNGKTFDSIATVLQRDESNLVERVFAQEKYAKNVGLIYKELLQIKKQPRDTADLPPYEDTTGVWYRLKVVEYGK